jgi:hypothetical protein
MGDQAAGWLREYAEGRDPAVRERVILAHMGLADRLAARYRAGPTPPATTCGRPARSR